LGRARFGKGTTSVVPQVSQNTSRLSACGQLLASTIDLFRKFWN
jgi:hypothetical protein